MRLIVWILSWAACLLMCLEPIPGIAQNPIGEPPVRGVEIVEPTPGLLSHHTLSGILSEEMFGLSSLIKFVADSETGDLYIFNSWSLQTHRFRADGRLENLQTVEILARGMQVAPERDNELRFDLTPGDSTLLYWSDGLTRLASLSLSPDSTVRTYSSRVPPMMFAHSAVSLPDEGLHVIGGYGLWQFWPYLLRFDEQLGTWVRRDTDPSPLPETNLTMLFHDPGTKRLHLLIDSQVNQELTLPYKMFHFFDYDLQSRTWHPKPDLAIPRKFLKHSDMNAQHWNRIGTHRFDPVSGFAYIVHNVIYDVHAHAFRWLDEPVLDHLYEMNIFSVERDRTFLVAGLDVRKPYPTPIEVIRLPIRDDYPRISHTVTGVELTIRRWLLFSSWTKDERWKPALVAAVVILVVAALFVWVGNRPKRGATSPDSAPLEDPHPPLPPAPMHLHRHQDGTVSARFQDEAFVPSDSASANLLLLIHDLHHRSQTGILLRDLDERIFPDNVTGSQISRSRNRLIHTFNQLAGRPFLHLKPSPTDRRFRMLQIDLDAVRIT